MRRCLFGLAVVLAPVAVTVTGLTQQRASHTPPDLSGTWRLVNGERTTLSSLGPQFTVEQARDRIALMTTRETVTYTIDWTENQRASKTVQGDIWTHRALAKFVGNALLITTRTDAGAMGEWEDLIVISLDPSGALNVMTCEPAKSREPAIGPALDLHQPLSTACSLGDRQPCLLVRRERLQDGPLAGSAVVNPSPKRSPRSRLSRA